MTLGMKIRTRPIWLLMALVLPATLLGLGVAEASAASTISVRGSAESEVRNDTGSMVVEAKAQAPHSEAAQARSAKRMSEVIGALEAAGVETDDISTTEVSLRQRKIGENDRRVYEATNRIKVTIREIDRTGRLIDLAVRSGATDIGQLQFFRSDERALYQEQLLLAYDEAHDKAQALADRAGMTLGDPIEITESGFRDSVRRYSAEASALGGGTPIRTGTSKVDARIYVVFEAS